jgi:hypothetical protein
LLPSIYPWLRIRCLAINNSSLLVSADMSHVPVARLAHTYFLRYFGPFGRMLHFSLLILFLILIQSGKRGKWNYTIHRKIVMPEHTYIQYIYIYKHCATDSNTSWVMRELFEFTSQLVEFCCLLSSTANIKENTQRCYGSQSCSRQYVQWPRLLKRCVSITVDFMGAIKILIANSSF